MPDFLVFQLYGALASWGDIAVGEHRPSLGHPTKSAVIGLLAAALGIERADEEKQTELAQNYGVAVCVRAAGELLRDYHTVQVPSGKRIYATRQDELLRDKLNLKTILSQRDYRTDAFYQVAIWPINDNPPFALAVLKKKLQQPYFSLYLGRKSCPVSLPVQPLIFSDVTLKQALDQYPLDKEDGKTNGFLESLMKSARLVSYYWEHGNLSDAERGMRASMSYPRRDQVSSRKRWQFANRDEFYHVDVVEEDG